MDQLPEAWELTAAALRLRMLAYLFPICDWGNPAPCWEAQHARERWRCFQRQQAEFVTRYHLS